MNVRQVSEFKTLCNRIDYAYGRMRNFVTARSLSSLHCKCDKRSNYPLSVDQSYSLDWSIH